MFNLIGSNPHKPAAIALSPKGRRAPVRTPSSNTSTTTKVAALATLVVGLGVVALFVRRRYVVSNPRKIESPQPQVPTPSPSVQKAGEFPSSATNESPFVLSNTLQGFDACAPITPRAKTPPQTATASLPPKSGSKRRKSKT
jgi:hypothetical protein